MCVFEKQLKIGVHIFTCIGHGVNLPNLHTCQSFIYINVKDDILNDD